MHQHRRLIALLLMVAYATASTLGMAFVVCVETNGTQTVEAVGAACCERTEARDGSRSRDDDARSERTGVAELTSPRGVVLNDCGGCEDYLVTVDADATRSSDRNFDPAAATAVPPPAPPSLTAWPIHDGGAAFARICAAGPPPSATIACLRTVILRC